jgi:hypothetical protein
VKPTSPPNKKAPSKGLTGSVSKSQDSFPCLFSFGWREVEVGEMESSTFASSKKRKEIHMTLLLAILFLYQFDWPWYWYGISCVLWGCKFWVMYAKHLRDYLMELG